MIINTKFDIFQEVVIKAINSKALITKIVQDGRDLWYTLEYWCNCEIKIVSLREEDLS